MREVDDYLAHAEHALDMLAGETDPSARKAFERAAKAWLQLAFARMDTLGIGKTPKARAVSLKLVASSDDAAGN